MDDRLESWKEIAGYLRRDVTTVQRWEKREGMPVHRHQHDRLGSIYAFRSELDAWMATRRPATRPEEPEPAPPDLAPDVVASPPAASDAPPPRPIALWLVPGLAVLMTTAIFLVMHRSDAFWRSPIADAQVANVTDFDGIEQAAAVSRDGQSVAFLSDREGRFDVWVTRLGSGRFQNLTRDTPRELVNRSVRTLGFTPDGTAVTFWSQGPDPAGGARIGVWAAPVAGGAPRPYLESAAELDWSPDGSRLVYHTPGPGDPMFVTDAGQPSAGRHLFTAPAGLHSHFPLWSADQAFIYFVHGAVPDRMDIWRIRPQGGAPERITAHDSAVSHPVVLDARTLMYLATDASGAGPSLYSIDVERRRAHRLSPPLERYTSLSASADGRRLVATQAVARPALWRVPIAESPAGIQKAARVALTTGSGSYPRLGPGYLLYVVRSAAGDSLWKLTGETATKLWSPREARIVGAPAIDGEGRRVAFAARQEGRIDLSVMNVDGSGLRVVPVSSELHGAPAWSPDGRSITSAVVEGGMPHLVSIPVEGGPPEALVSEHSLDPAWSPDGRFVVFSGPDIGTRFAVRAVAADGHAHPLRELTLTRGARRLRFLPGRAALVVMRGEMQHKDLWLIDLATGEERPLTALPPEFELRDFDVSPDGREAVLEQSQEQSDVVLFDLKAR
jgi:Tol biopolymer transport system component